jgi:hypothetical protein
MHRSGTSAVTRLVGLLGLSTPPEADLVQPTSKNPRGYWESESLVAFNERLLRRIGCDIGCPFPLAIGWEEDPRLDPLRADARDVVREIFPVAPWVWKDPRHCLAFGFWHAVLDVEPVVVLVNRNPLEITASAQRVRSEQGKVYSLALWERYLRQALAQISGLPVLVVRYEDVLADPLAWCAGTRVFLVDAGVPATEARESDVVQFIDDELRHTRFTRADVREDPKISGAQRSLFSALEELEGGHRSFVPPELPHETPTTEPLLAERRRRLEVVRELDAERKASWGWKLRSSKYAATARPLYTRGRRLLKSFGLRGSR